MTAFPNAFDDGPDQLIRQRRTDAAIAQNRAVTPPAAVEQRTKPRLSIKEINESDIDELRQRLAETTRDNRPTFVKALDIVDLPRNLVANALFSATGAVPTAGKEKATFGLPRISFSDALKEMGVKNRVVTGLAGFVGDVALDPLSYAGPAGWGVKAGKTALRGGGKRALNRGIDLASKAGLEAVDDPTVKRLLTVAGYQPGMKRGDLSARLWGGRVGGRVGQGLESTLSRVGGETTRSGGFLDEMMGKSLSLAKDDAERESIAAVREFVERYGRGTGGGIKIGEGGSEIAHIPFTDKTLQVPGFTATGKSTRRQLQVAASRRAAQVAGLAPDVAAMQQGLDAIRQGRESIESASAAYREERATLGPEFQADRDALHELQIAQERESLNQIRADLGRRFAALKPAAFAASDRDADAFVALGQMLDEADRAVESAGAQSKLAKSMSERFRAAKASDTVYTPETPGGDPRTELQLERSRLEGNQAALWNHLAEDPAGYDAMVDAHAAAFDAAQKYRAAIGGTLGAHISREQRDTMELAKWALGIDDEEVGSLFSPLKTVLDSTLGDNADTPIQWIEAMERSHAKRFGRRQGAMQRHLANIQARLTRASDVAGLEIADTLRKEIRKAAAEAGIPASQWDDLDHFVTLKMVDAVSRRIGLDPTDVFYLKRVENGKLVDGPLLESLEKTRLAIGDKPGFMKAIDELTAKQAESVASMGDLEAQDRLLSQILPGYIPGVPTQEAKGAISNKMKSAAWRTSEAGRKSGEFFQRPKVTYKYQFQGPDGEWREFIEGDRALSEMSDAALAAMDPKARAAVEAVRESMNLYDNLPVKPPPRPMDPAEINRLASEGRFATIYDRNAAYPFFETSWPVLMGQRTAAHERAVARADLLNIVGKYALPVDPQQWEEAINLMGSQKSFTTKTGEVGTLLTVRTGLGNNVGVLRLPGGRSYRMLDRTLSKWGDNPIVASLTEGIDSFVLPEQLADRIEQIAMVWQDDFMGGILREINRATGFWRTLTLFHPSWIVGNLVGDLTLAASGGVNPKRMVDKVPQLTKLWWKRHDPEYVRNFRLPLTGSRAGEELTGEQILEMAGRQRSKGDHMPAEIAHLLSQRGYMMLPSQKAKMGVVPGLKADMEWSLDTYAQSLTKPGAAAFGGARMGMERMHRRFFAPWLKANQGVSDVMRTSALLTLFEDGFDEFEAGRKMARAMFDYGDLSVFEAKWLRTIFPFATWIRNNLAYQVSLLMEKPSIAASVPKLHTALEEMIAGDQRVPVQNRPGWMRTALATQLGSDPNERFSLSLGTLLPQAEVFNALTPAAGTEGAMDALRYYGSNINPLLTIPLQLGSGTEFFSGRQIGPTPEEGDISAGQFLAGSIRPVAEFGPGGKVGKAFERSPVEGAARSVLGGRIQGFSDERLRTTRLREYKDEETGLRRAISRSERNKDHKGSLRARAKLLALYADMEKNGFAEDVPDWYFKQAPSLVE